MSKDGNFIALVGGTVLLLGVIVGGGLYGCPQYNVYSSRLSGEATLAEAQSSRMAKVSEAKARYESAEFDAKAEVARARGTKESNNIVISSFGSTEERLKYLQIEAMREAAKAGTVIYVPTEGGLPITEAGKR